MNRQLLDEARGSELAPDKLEDDGGRVGIVLQPHVAVPLPPLVPEFRHVRRAPLRRTVVEQFGYTDNCPGCANARAGRKQAVDHSEQRRSRMETILSTTTTKGHERLERARDRFAQAAKEPEDEEPQRKRHRPVGRRGGSLLRRPGKGVAAAVAAVRRCRLRQRHGHLNHRHLQNWVWNRRPKCLMQPSNSRENRRGAGSIQKCLKLRKAVAAAAAMKAQPTLKWAWWTCARYSVKIQRCLKETDFRGNL